MSDFVGKSKKCRVEIVAVKGWLARYIGQQCDAIFYESDDGQSVMPHIDTEQLRPPLPRWQSANPEDLEVK